MDLSFFFRYHYTKGADAAAAGTETAASLLSTLGGAARSEKTLRFQASLRAEWSQNNLPFIGDIRSYSNPGNRFFFPFLLSFFFIYFHLSFLPSTNFLVTTRASVFRRAIIFAAFGVLLHEPGDNASSASSGRGKRASEKFAAVANFRRRLKREERYQTRGNDQFS